MTRAALALLLLTTPLAAQYGNLTLTMEPAKTTVFSGERLDVTVTVDNHGGEATLLNFHLTVVPGQQLVSVTAPPGWVCFGNTPDGIACAADKMSAGTRSVFPVRVLVLNSLDEPTTALSIHANPEQSTVLPGGNAAIALDVRNDGPDTAHNVTVRAWYPEDLGALMSGTGWTCGARSCTRAALAPRQSAPIAFSFPTPAEAFYVHSFSLGADLSFDPDGTDNFAATRTGVGDAATWRRILLPLSFAETPGAFGSRWKTEIRALVDSATAVELQPRHTCFRPAQCAGAPLHRPFDLTTIVMTMSHLPTQFLYVRTADEPKLSLNLRVRDLTRTAETWGTEVPAVREHEWRTTAIVLAPLPVDPLFRWTLRVYDFDPAEGHRVVIRIYADDESEPRITLVKDFTALPWTVTTALLPAYPGYLQLDPLAETGTAMAGAKTAWIRVEPLTPGLRFWAFASVTNNPTGHVTTVTP